MIEAVTLADRSLCQHKRSYANKQGAKKALKAIQSALSHDAVKPVRAYKCKCGGWHLTTKRGY